MAMSGKQMVCVCVSTPLMVAMRCRCGRLCPLSNLLKLELGASKDYHGFSGPGTVVCDFMKSGTLDVHNNHPGRQFSYELHHVTRRSSSTTTDAIEVVNGDGRKRNADATYVLM